MLLATSVGHGRKVLTARTSRDGGDSWDHYAKLEAGPAGYSALAELSDGWAAVLYEAKWLLKPPPESKRSNPKPVEEEGEMPSLDELFEFLGEEWIQHLEARMEGLLEEWGTLPPVSESTEWFKEASEGFMHALKAG